MLHALHRSQVEYVASLAKGMRQTGADLPFKTNRHGYVAAAGPVLSLSWTGADGVRRPAG